MVAEALVFLFWLMTPVLAFVAALCADFELEDIGGLSLNRCAGVTAQYKGVCEDINRKTDGVDGALGMTG